VLGNDPIFGAPRLTLGIEFLEGGIPFLPVLIGVFAFAQIMGDVEKMGAVGRAGAALERGVCRAVSHAQVLWEIQRRPVLLLWAAFIGVVIGVLPAIGGSRARCRRGTLDESADNRRHNSAPEGQHSDQNWHAKQHAPRRSEERQTQPNRPWGRHFRPLRAIGGLMRAVPMSILTARK
jgi:hypothetical protein